MYTTDKIYVYIEKSNGKTLLIDFIESNTYNTFLNLLSTIDNTKTFLDPSMVLINNYEQKRLEKAQLMN